MPSKKVSPLPFLVGLFRSPERRDEKADSHLLGWLWSPAVSTIMTKGKSFTLCDSMSP